MRLSFWKPTADASPVAGMRTLPADDGEFAEAVRRTLATIPEEEHGRPLHREERVHRLLLALRERYPSAWAREQDTAAGDSVWAIFRDRTGVAGPLAAAGRRR